MPIMRTSEAISKSVYVFTPTGKNSWPQPRTNLFFSARTKVRFAERAATSVGARSSGPASTRTAVTCHSCRARAAPAKSAQSASQRARTSGGAMHAAHPEVDGERRDCAGERRTGKTDLSRRGAVRPRTLQTHLARATGKTSTAVLHHRAAQVQAAASERCSRAAAHWPGGRGG